MYVGFRLVRVQGEFLPDGAFERRHAYLNTVFTNLEFWDQVLDEAFDSGEVAGWDAPWIVQKEDDIAHGLGTRICGGMMWELVKFKMLIWKWNSTLYIVYKYMYNTLYTSFVSNL